MPLTAPFNLSTRQRSRAYLDKYEVNGESYSLPELLNFLSQNLGGAGTDDITEGVVDPVAAPVAGSPFVYQNTTTGELFVWNGTAWVSNGQQGPLPVFDNQAAAVAGGIVSGMRWKYSGSNTEGMPAGVVVEAI